MSDPIGRWLRIQQELGGDEAILDAPLAMRGSGAVRQPAVIREAPVEAPAIVATPTRPPRNAPLEPGGVPDWLTDAPPIPGPGLTVDSPASGEAAGWGSLDEIAAIVTECTRCPLCRGRTHAVPGEGNRSAGLMVVGEGPGESEDLSGRPFVGRAGELLDKMLAAIGLPRADVFIANVVKCRPPKNRVPLPEERDACMPFLRRQVALVGPRVLLALGGTAAEALLGLKAPLGQLRNKVHTWNGIPLVVTYHPAALLRNPNWKRPAWDDVRIARQLLDRDT